MPSSFCANLCVVAAVTVWLDTRTAVTVNEMIAKTPGFNQDHLRVPHLSSCQCKIIMLSFCWHFAAMFGHCIKVPRYSPS